MASIIGTKKSDVLTGTKSNDTIIGDNGDDLIDGDKGSDSIDGGGGRDILFGGDGSDTLVGGQGADIIHGGAGSDFIGLSDNSRNTGAGGGRGDLIFGDGYNTYVLVSGVVGSQNLTTTQHLGDDTIHGTADADTIHGDNGNNPDGSAPGGNDVIFAGNSADTVYGEGGNDSIAGEGGDDDLSGGSGSDTVLGGDGNDVLIGGLGLDQLDGGAGDDRFVYLAVADSTAAVPDSISGFSSGFNYLSGDKIDITVLLGAGSDVQWTGTIATANGAWYQPAGSGTNLYVDVTGDGIADLAVYVSSVLSLQHSDVLGVINDAPAVVADMNTGDAVREAAALFPGDAYAAGNVLANDADADGDSLVVTTTGVFTGLYGTLTLGVDGAWTYTLNNADADTDALAHDQSVSDVFSYTVSDGLASSSGELAISITGTNDRAVITGASTGSVVEAGGVANAMTGTPTATGDLFAFDVDNASDAFQAVVAGTRSRGGLGTYEVTADGIWTYTLNNLHALVQAHGVGETFGDQFFVRSQDGTVQAVTITINGANDAPVITSEALPDIIAASAGGGNNAIFRNLGGFQFDLTGETLANNANRGYPYGMSAGDVNGDGRLDLAISGDNGYGQIFLNHGDGTFNDSGNLFPARFQGVNHFADIDQDGDLDVMFSNTLGSIDLYANDGTGQFSLAQSIGGGTPNSAQFGDFNADGLVDIFTSWESAPNRLFLNNGSGQFVDSGEQFPVAWTYHNAIGDLDGNGALDIAIATYDGPSRIYFNDGQGHFTDSGQSFNPGGGTTQGFAGDLNGDGASDLVFSGTYGGQFWLNNGSGQFTSAGSLAGPVSELVDLNQDGSLDLIVGNFPFGLDLYANDGQGNFSFVSSLAGAFTAVEAADFLANYVTDDASRTTLSTSGTLGFSDVDVSDTHIVSVSSSGNLGTLTAAVVQDTTGTGRGGSIAWSYQVAEAAVQYLGEGESRIETLGIQLADGNGGVASTNVTVTIIGHNDGPNAAEDIFGSPDLDLVAIAYLNGMRVYTNDGSGSFAHTRQTFPSSSGLSVTVGDLDGDGDLDVVAGTPQLLPTRVYLNDGSGHFTDTGQALGSSPSEGVTLGDVDGDGDLDIVAANQQGQPIQIWLNDGSGTFSAGQQIAISPNQSVALGDLDMDGDLDMVTATLGAANHVLTNDGTGTFTDTGQTLGTTEHTTAVQLADLDGDGDLDMAEGNFNAPSRTWMNDGTGQFTDGGQALAAGAVFDLAVGDLDADGDIDLAVASYFGGPGQVFINDGAGNFTDSGQALTVVQGDLIGLDFGDVDGDGDLDLAYAVELGPDRIFLNDGAGNFSDSGQALDADQQTRDVVLVDLDGDSVTYTVGAPHVLDVLANDADVDGDLLGVISVDAVSRLGAAITIRPDGTVLYDPTEAATLIALGAGEIVLDRFTYTVSDGHGGTDTQTATIFVEGIAQELVGQSGDDTLQGTSGNDILVGAAGNDVLTGGGGDDVFVWQAGNEGTDAVPAVDMVTDFGDLGDTLRLSDLLVGENSGNLEDYLSFTLDGADTTVRVKSAGASGVVDQKIVLAGLNLTVIGDDGDIISALISQGKLITD